jgi:hypothetical protein
MPLITERMQQIINYYAQKINNENRFLVAAIADLMERVEKLEKGLKEPSETDSTDGR